MMIFSSFLPQTSITFAETDDSGQATAISSSSSESTTSGAGTVVNPPDQEHEVDYAAAANQLYNEITDYYEGENNWNSQVTLAYANGGGAIDTAIDKSRNYSVSGLYNAYQGIFRALALELDPRAAVANDNTVVNYVQIIEEKQNDDGKFNSSTETNLLILQASKIGCATIDEEKAIDYMASKLSVSDNKAYSGSSVDNTARILIALTMYPEMSQSQDLIPKCVNWLKAQQNSDAGIGSGPESTALAARALLNAGEDIFSEEYIKGDNDNKKTILDYINDYKLDSGAIKSYSYGTYPNADATMEVYVLLSELQHNKSMFQRYSAKVGTIASQLIVSDDTLNLIERESSNITVKAYDSEDLAVPSTQYKWTSSDTDIVTVDDGHVTANKAGQATIIVEDANNSAVKTEVNVVVEKEIISKFELKLSGEIIETINFLKDDTKELQIVAYNQKNQEIINPDYTINLIQEETYIVNNKLQLTAQNIGAGKIKVLVATIEKSLDFSVIDIDTLVTQKLDYFKNNLIKDTSLNDFEILLAGAYGIINELDTKKFNMNRVSCKRGYYNEDPQEYGTRILSLLAQGKDPYDDDGQDIIQFLVDCQDETGFFYTKSSYNDDEPEYIAAAMLGLDAAGASYNVQKSVDLLINNIIVSGDKAYIKRYSYNDYEKIMLVTTALSNHREIDGVEEILSKVDNYLSDEFQNNSLAGKKLGQIAITFNALNKSLNSISKTVDGQDVSLLKLLCQDEENCIEIYAGLIGHIHTKSIYQSVDLVVGEPASINIEIIDDKQLIKVASKVTYSINVKDADNKKIKDYDYVIEALTPDIITIDKNNREIIGKNPGKTAIKVTLVGTDLTTTTFIEVITPKVIRTELNPVISLDTLENGKRLKFDPISYDTDEAMTPYKYDWRITPSEAGLMDGNVFVAKNPGPVKIDYIVTNKDETFVTTSYEITISEAISKKILAQNAIEETYMSIESKSSYDYMAALALRNAKVGFKKIQEKMNIYNIDGIHSTSRNIMTLIGANVNPKNKKDVLESLVVDGSKEQQYYSKLLIALDMMKSTKNHEAIINEISKTLKTDGDQKYIEISVEEYDPFWEETTWVDQECPEETLWTWIALSSHKDIDGVSEILTGIENYVIANIDENLLVNDNSIMTALAIQGIIANGYSVSNDKFTKLDLSGNKLTLIDGILACQKEGKFTSNPKSYSSFNTTEYAINALSDYIANSLTFNRIRYIEVSEPNNITIEVSADSYVEGDELTLTANIYDINHLQILDENVDWSIEPADSGVFEKVNNQMVNLTLLKPGTTKIIATVTNHNKISSEVSIAVKSCIDKTLLDNRVKKEIEFFKTLYSQTNKRYEFIAAPAAVGIGLDKEYIGEKILHYSSTNSISNVSKQIIALIGGGLSPRKYQKNKDSEIVNLVDLLIAHQESSGDAIGQFAFRASDYDSLYNTAISIVALDMAQGAYNEINGINALIKLVEIELEANSSREAEYLAYALIALAPHDDIEGVNTTIEKIKKRLHEIQNEDAGFDLNDGQHKSSPIATGLVIQGLIAVNENPLYEAKWIKNRKTVLDALLLTKHEDTDISKSGYYQYVGFEMTNYKALYHAYAAMSDLYNGKSMFIEQRLDEQAGTVTDKTVAKILPKGDRWTDDLLTLAQGERFILEANSYNANNQLIKDIQLKWTTSDAKLSVENNNELVANEITTEPITLSIIANSNGEQFIKEVKVSIEKTNIKQIDLNIPYTLFKTDEKITLSSDVYNQFDTKIINDKVIYTLETISGKNVAAFNEESNEISFLSPGTIDVKAIIKDDNTTIVESSVVRLNVIKSASKNVFVSVYGMDKFGETKVIYPLKAITVDNFDLGSYGNGIRQFYESPVAMNALIKRLEIGDLDCHDKNSFDALGNLSFLNGIGGLTIDSSYPNSGWMYYLNDAYSSKNMNEQEINDGDHINVFYVQDYENINYYAITANSDTTAKNQKIKVTLTKKIKIPNTNDYKTQAIENAIITINGSEAISNGETIKTNDLGQAIISFTEDGEYLISAKILNETDSGIPPSYLINVTDSSLMDNIEMSYSNLESLNAGYESSFEFSFMSTSEEDIQGTFEVVLFEDNNSIQKNQISRQIPKNIRMSEKMTFLLPESNHLSIKIFYIDEAGNKELIKSYNIEE